ncbi:ABC transporter ATP-binding protein [Lentzea sp.]|uniref:ABC transporter ATP-binding protein n=1 Tax=Lentzea sp. TaxID=56099 RepID=UPI002ED52986
MTPLVEVADLTARAGTRLLLDDVSFRLTAGEVTALVGPSGSGKTTAALALLGEHRHGVELSGRVTFDGQLVIGVQGVQPHAHRIRGRSVAYLPQHPGAALNPARRIGSVLGELARLHTGDQDAVGDALRTAGLEDDRALRRRFPHQFSGGQRQRIALAEALVCRPRVLVLDEPTTGLDTVTKLHVVEQLAELARTGLAILLLTHDLPVVSALADNVVALRAGRVKAVTVTRPEPIAVPSPAREPGAGPVLEVVGLGATHRTAGRSVSVLHDVSFALAPGRCLGLVGASGSGKTTLARCLAGLHDRVLGDVRLDGRPLPVLRRRSIEDKRRVQYVWQEVRGSFEEGRPVLGEVARTAVRLRGLSTADARAEAVDLLAELGVDEQTASRPPARMSGGELQRAALVRALLARPDVLVCDEVTTALDADSARSVLDLLTRLRRDHRTAVVLISHDLRAVCAEADHLVVLESGCVADSGPPGELLVSPGSPVTAALVEAAELGMSAHEPEEIGHG